MSNQEQLTTVNLLSTSSKIYSATETYQFQGTIVENEGRADNNNDKDGEIEDSDEEEDECSSDDED